jgi:hypothetical protein
MTEVTPFWMREALYKQTCKRSEKQISHKNNKTLNAAERCGPQGQGKLTRPSWNAQFNKEKNRPATEFSKKLTQHQPMTNIF